MKNKSIVLGFLVLVLESCSTSTNSYSQPDSIIIAESSSQSANFQNSLDYVGTYTGVLPCADCPGIQTEITLDPDGSFTKKMTYLENKDADVFEETGTYTWDDSGKMITLVGLRTPNQYFVGEKTLTQLDRAGKKVKGSLADLYVLKK